MKPRKGTSLVYSDGGRQRVKTPQARLGDAQHANGIEPGVLAIDHGSAGEEKPSERDANGRFLPGAKAGPKKGAAAKNRTSKLARDLGLATTLQQPGFAPFLRDAKNLARAVLAELAQLNGGHVSAIVGTAVQGAALQTAASRFLFSKGDMLGGSRLANDARSSLVYARHMAAADGLARKAGGNGLPALDAATEAELDREVAELVAAHSKSTPKGDDAEPGNDVVTEPSLKQPETEECS